MSIQQNIADYMQMVKRSRNSSVTEFSAELEISRAALQSYLKGTGNPSLNTINHMAQKLGIDPVIFVSGEFTPVQIEIILSLINAMKCFTTMSEEKRAELAELVLKILNLLEEHDGGEDTQLAAPAGDHR